MYINDLSELVTKTVTANTDYITSYVSAKVKGKLLHIAGLFVVNTEIPINTTILTIDDVDIDSGYSSFVASNTTNRNVTIDGSNHVKCGGSYKIPTGTYCIDTWAPLK